MAGGRNHGCCGQHRDLYVEKRERMLIVTVNLRDSGNVLIVLIVLIVLLFMPPDVSVYVNCTVVTGD